MPQEQDAKVRARGGAVRVRTVKIGQGRYAHVFVVRRKGPRGGRTVIGQIKRRKPRGR